MKTLIPKLLLVLLIGRALCAAEQARDIYQHDIAPDLVKKVDMAKEKQVDGSDLKQAESLLSDVVKKKPDYYRALYNLGLVYESKGEYEKAIKTLKEAEAVRYGQGIPDNSILNSLGWAYLNVSDFDKAEDYFKAAYATRDGNTPITNERVLNNLGFLYLQKGQTVEARKYLTESKERFQSATAANLLKLVNDYERRQNQTRPAEEDWAVYGQQPKAGGSWNERHFNVEGNDKASIPKPNETVIAFDNVYIRSATPVWDNEAKDYVLGPIVGYIKPGDKVRVLKVVDNNSPSDKNAWYWILLSRVESKE